MQLFICYTFEKKDLNFVNINGSMSSCKTIFAIMNPTHLQPQVEKYQEDDPEVLTGKKILNSNSFLQQQYLMSNAIII